MGQNTRHLIVSVLDLLLNEVLLALGSVITYESEYTYTYTYIYIYCMFLASAKYEIRKYCD